MAPNKFDTIVVGGGMAGLTAAAYLVRNGQKVLLIEKNKECGGLVNTFMHNGFHFEAGVRALLDAGIVIPMLGELNIQLEVLKSPVSVGIDQDIINIEDIDDLKDYRALLVKYYPASEEEIDAVMKIIRQVMRNMDVLYGIENPNFKDLQGDRTFLFTKLLPWLPKFLFTIGKINRMDLPVEEFLEKIVTDRSLLDMITQHFFKNTPSFFALSYFSLYLDYFYPKGGVGKLAEAVENKYLELGGEILRETKVMQILAGNQKVIDHNGIVYQYDNLIWAADLKTLYRITDVGDSSTKVQSDFEGKKSDLLEKRGGDSVYTLYLEVDEPVESFRNIAHGHFFYTPLTHGLGEVHRKELDTMIKNWESIDKQQLWDWLDRFIRLNTFEISIPVLKDPEMAPPGKTGVIISVLAEYDLFSKVESSGWHEEFILKIEDKIIQVLADSVYPMLRDKVIYRFSFTPLSIERRVGSSEGAITGWSFQEPVPVIHKIQQSGRSVITPIPNIFQAGQWTYSPGGVPMSILTGKLAANRVLKRS